MTKVYELTVLFSPQLTSEELQKVQTKVSSIVTAQGGKVLKTDVWGRKFMTYKINKHEEAVYVVYTVQVDALKAPELEKNVRLTDGVIRHLFVISETQE